MPNPTLKFSNWVVRGQFHKKGANNNEQYKYEFHIPFRFKNNQMR